MRTFYLKQKFFKITDNYMIKDDEGNDVYHVKEKFRPIGKNISITNHETGVSCTIKQKLFHLFATYTADFSNGQTILIQQKLSFLRPKLELQLNHTKLTVKGSIPQYSFSVFHKGHEIAEIKKVVFSFTDQFRVIVKDEQFQDAIIATVIAIDAIQDKENHVNAGQE